MFSAEDFLSSMVTDEAEPNVTQRTADESTAAVEMICPSIAQTVFIAETAQTVYTEPTVEACGSANVCAGFVSSESNGPADLQLITRAAASTSTRVLEYYSSSKLLQ